MAQVLPAEGDLRRVIGDGEGVPDGEVEGLTDHDLVELYRGMVLLRTYDERSVVYHRQGRIGTYAIYWNHEAMQAGSVYALEDDDWIFPSYRESAIGLLRGMPAATILSWWRGHPAGWWNPADYNVASICVPIGRTSRTRRASPGGRSCAARRPARSRTSATGRPPRAPSTRAPTSRASPRAARSSSATTTSGRSRRRSSAQTAPTRSRTRRSATGSGRARGRADILAVFEATRDAVARARAGEGPSFIEAVSYRAAPHATADDPRAYIDLERVEEEKRRECLGRFEGYLRPRGLLTDEMAESVQAEAADMMRAAIAAAEAEPPADVSLLFDHALADPPASFEADLAELRGSWEAPWLS